MLFLRLKKAFDCVDHDILLMKMYTYGIQDQALKCFTPYLTGRVQICKVKQTMSSKRIIKCGVPQGLSHGANVRKINESLNEESEKVRQWLLSNKIVY